MSKNYASPLPRDKEEQTMQEYAVPKATTAVTVRENASASSVTSLNDATTTLEVGAVGTGAAIRWATNQATSIITAASGAAFDNYIPVGTVRRFVVPRRIQAVSSVGGVNVIEGLFNNVATQSTGNGSVLLAQY